MDGSEVIQPVVACLGFPVAGNPTQFLMERAVLQLGLDWRFVTLQVEPDQFEQAALGVRALGFAGTFFLPPFLHRAVDFCDELTLAAQTSRAVRLARRQDAKWIGNDTMAAAIMALLPENILKVTSRILCLGNPSICQILRTMEPLLTDRLDDSFPSDRNPTVLVSPTDASVPMASPSDTQEYSAIIVEGSSVLASPKRMAALPLSAGARILLLDDDGTMDRWKEFALQRGMTVIHPIDLSVQHYIESLFFLTGQRGSPILIREGLEEYLNW